MAVAGDAAARRRARLQRVRVQRRRPPPGAPWALSLVCVQARLGVHLQNLSLSGMRTLPGRHVGKAL